MQVQRMLAQRVWRAALRLPCSCRHPRLKPLLTRRLLSQSSSLKQPVTVSGSASGSQRSPQHSPPPPASVPASAAQSPPLPSAEPAHSHLASAARNEAVPPAASSLAASATSASPSSLSSVLSPAHRRIVVRTKDVFERLPAQLKPLQLSAEHRRLIRDALHQLEQLFTLVVVGEYNSGKSSFLNALLGGDYCKTGVLPTTDKICILRYSPSASSPSSSSPSSPLPAAHVDDPSSPDIQSLYLPVPWLQHITVVDTPGTNAIIVSHEQLTSSFIPRADCIVFLTSVERPFSESERVFMQRIRQWGKRLLCVINKHDLLDSEQDRAAIVRFVKENVQREVGEDVTVFTVSARQAIAARPAAAPASGLPQVEQFLFQSLTATEKMRLKLSSPVGVAARLLNEYGARLRAREEKGEDDARLLVEMEREIGLWEREVRKEAELQMEKVERSVYQRMDAAEQTVNTAATMSNLFGLLGRSELNARLEHAVFDGLAEELQDGLSALIDVVNERTQATFSSINGLIHRRNAQLARRAAAGRSDSVGAATPPAAPASPVSPLIPPAAADESALLPVLELSSLSSSTPSHQQFLQLQHEMQTQLSPAFRSSFCSTSQSELSFASKLTLATQASSLSLLGLYLSSVLPALAAPFTYAPPVAAAVLALSSLYFVPSSASRAVRRQRQQLDAVRLALRSAMDRHVERVVDERRRRLLAARGGIERRVGGERDELVDIKRGLEEAQRDVSEIRDMIRLAQ